MIRVLLAFVFLIMAPSLRGQNLISNPGFEDENICTEYTKNCAPEGWIAVSLYANYYFDELGMAAEGRHFVGLTAGSIRKPNVRNFVRTRLLCGMRKGKVYHLEFFARSVHPLLDSIGVYFTPDDFLHERRLFKDLNPQLWTADAKKSEPNAGGWVKCSFDYTATGDEGYITVGNFRRTDITGVRKTEINSEYYFYVDNFSLVPEDPNEHLCLQADSVRQAIYEENERHEYLNRRMYVMRKRVPVNQPLPPTVFELPEPQQVIDTLIIPDIFFATAKYNLLRPSFKLLDSFVNQLHPEKIDSIIIEGHTDSIGKFDYNMDLSRNRAGSVQDYLSGKLAVLMHSRGFGYLRPVTTNSTIPGRKKNRRVEIIVFRRQ
ncbi:MAG TPA: OmpA family protein [Flavitalea sp.]|nr:OmpA family protein [Flavitalea sp.]